MNNATNAATATVPATASRYNSGFLSHEHYVFEKVRASLMAGKKAVRIHPVMKTWDDRKRRRGVTYELYNKVAAMLDRYGISYTEGNDAPRGGQLGDYIEFTVDRRQTLWKKAASWIN